MNEEGSAICRTTVVGGRCRVLVAADGVVEMNGGRHNADTRGTGHTPGGINNRLMPIEMRCASKVERSVDGTGVDVMASSSWLAGTSLESVAMFGGTLSEWSMACLTGIDLDDRIAGGRPGVRLIGKCARCGWGRNQEMDVDRGSEMRPVRWTDGSTNRPQAAALVNGEQLQPWSLFAEGSLLADVAVGGRLLIGRGEGESSREGSVGATCDGKNRHGIEQRSGKRGDRQMGRGMTQLMTDRGARRARTGNHRHVTHGVILREDDIAAQRISFSRAPLGGCGSSIGSGREAVDADCQRWRRQIGRRGSGEDPEAATPWWAGRWCEASP